MVEGMTSSPLGAKDLQECSLLSSEVSQRGEHACMWGLYRSHQQDSLVFHARRHLLEGEPGDSDCRPLEGWSAPAH